MFDHLEGNERAKETLRRMLRQGRVPGALLFAGGEGLGKKLFAVELARALNCRSRAGVEACGKCPACVRAGKFNLPPADDADANKQILWSEHRDVGMVRAAGRSIPVGVVRELERETNFRPFEGAARVFIVDGADRLNEASSNALLKTLEEVQPTSHLVLITSRPASLLPTIRSRCQSIRFAPLTVDEVERFLIDNGLRAGEEARLAAHLSGGRPGLAIEMNLDRYRAHREEMLVIVEALAGDGDRGRLLRAAEDLSDAKHKEEFEPRLDVLEILVRDLWLLTLDPSAAHVVNYDLRARLSQTATRVDGRRAAGWIARIEKLREQLAVNVNRRVASDALLLSMADAPGRISRESVS
ncbi:MAG TPA: DNA polymerase III subunit delta' [Pyrinomonadaceae bacterium]|nr:DNA polymerase III subunit delta' [Pyrinomonadaceae bacterium]